ncbi:hypothetical protein [Roseateles saccharophilus]|uniref:Uncharacterized protein n=1 Tax=Roseateles saccharophilus TaxID=304 RepID=A0A4R3VHB7_ROSSA|nr:hypothetical protein [Roseateles saccharophilus]MDG0832055.1 hypothetical protein [Roseateles saccharophilus]TCV03463.1 hypothetical protein EV671_1003118 [Roseateles saccharophilus]
MIYVIHQPAAGEASAWFAFDADDLLRKVAAGDALPAHAIWDRASARELLALFDESPAAGGVRERFPGICALGDADGWDTLLHRADYLHEAGLYAPQPTRCEEACFAALRARGGQWKFYENEPHALAAVDLPDPLYDAPGGWRARWALRQQLIAVEALADDL